MPAWLPFRRRHLMRAVAVLAFGIVPSQLDAQRPTMPRVRPEPCEGYCKPVWASCARITLRAAPSEKAAVTAVLDSGVRASVLERQYHVPSPGVVLVRRSFTWVEQHDQAEGPPVTPRNPRRWNFRVGDTIYVVDKDTDGDSYVNYVWMYGGKEATTASFWEDDRNEPDAKTRARLLSPMGEEWWVRMQGPAGQTGWARSGNEWTGRSYYDDPIEKCAK